MVYFKFEFGWGKSKKEAAFSSAQPATKGLDWVNAEVEKARKLGRYKTASNYLTAAHSWTLFIGKEDWLFPEMTSETLDAYQRWLGERDICLNTISAYMRALRVMYHRVMESEGNDCHDNPFDKVFTGRAKTIKRSVTQVEIQQLHTLQLEPGTTLSWARDIFLFSFYAMGMPFVDIAYLKKSQVKDGYIHYARHKTGQRIQVALLPAMIDIMKRYEQENSEFVFPILVNDPPAPEKNVASPESLHQLYQCRLRQYNYSLHRLSERLNWPRHLSSYVVRHSWASIAYQHHVDIGLIGKALGHTKSSTTLLYIKSLTDPDLATANESLMQELGL